MARELTPPWWVESGALAELVAELRAAGFRVGAEHLVAARRLALTRLAAGERGAAGLGELLAPAMCSSPAEQERFPLLFAAWAERRGRRQVDAPREPREPALARALAAAERRRRRWLLALALAVAAAVAAVLLWPSATDDGAAPPAVDESLADTGPAEVQPVEPPEGFPDPSVFVNPLPDTTPLPEKPKGWRERIGEWLAARWRIAAAGGAVLGLLLAAYLLWRLKARRALQRLTVKGELEMGRLPVAEAVPELFGRHALQRAGRELRRRAPEGALELDAVASAAAGRLLVTGSFDKSVRLWDLEDGRLLRVLRPPSGAGNEGKVYAVALSPDGERIAAGGWTTPAQLENIYLFDRRSGGIVRHISDVAAVVHHLAFSPDGRRLAATLGSGGLRAFDAAGGEELFRDADYGGGSYGASFDPAGRLVTSCEDGRLRLYDAVGRRLAVATAPGGEPFGVAFSPDGRRVAVGYYDSVRVDVLSGDDLSLLWSADSTGGNGDLSQVAWSADGEVLYAAGRFDVGGPKLRQWTDAGRGSFRDLPGPANTVMGLHALADGRLVFGATDPAWGVFDPAVGEAERLERLAPLVDFRGLLEGFHIDRDGETVRFGYEYGGARPALFVLPGRRLLHDPPDPPTDDPLAAPRTAAPGLEIEGWKGTTSPRLNGMPLPLEDFERSRRLAIAADGESFLLGTEWYLRLFDRDGDERWRKDVPGVAWAVNLTPDGRLALAAFGDGTIRWYRADDGEELLAFFPHRDGRRWVLFTPSGYYDASPGEGPAAGESLFGWTVNRGRDRAADFYSAARFKDRFHRPDVIDRILTTLDEAEAVAQADAARAGG